MSNFYRVAGYPFRLAVYPASAHELGCVLDDIFSIFRLSQPPDEPLKGGFDSYHYQTRFGVLTCEAEANYHRIEIHLTPSAVSQDPVDVAYRFEPEIINQAIRESPPYLWFHGASLVRDDALILLIAATGTGKTTLSLGLLRHGYRMLTDDVILIDPATRQFIPVPRCPKYREPAPENLKAIGFDLDSEARTMGRYVLLPTTYFQTCPIVCPVRRVFFLQRAPESPPGPCELSMTDGLLALMPHSNLLALDPELRLATDLFAGTQFITLNLSSYPDDLAYIAG